MSVRSIIDGNLTLNNLNVTTINSVAFNPYPTGIGTIVNGANPPNPYTVVSGSSLTIDSITLEPGVWLVQVACQFGVSAGTFFSIQNFLLGVTNTPPIFAQFSELNGLTVDAGTLGNFQVLRTAIINLTVTTTIPFTTRCNFTGGTGVFIARPLATNQQYITATKLA